MKTLNALLHFVVQNTQKKDLNYLKLSLTEEERVLMEGILEHNYQTDLQASNDLFGIKSNTIKYQRIKKKLNDRLYDAVLFITPSLQGSPKFLDELIELNKVGSTLNVLNYFMRRDLSLPLIEQHFNKAYKYFMHNEVLLMANTMRLYFGITEPNNAKYKYYNKIYEEAIYHLHWELKANYYYEMINTRFGRNKKVDKDAIISDVIGFLEELSPHEGKVRSQKFHRDFYNLKMVFHHVQNQYHEVVEVCNDLLDYLDTLEFTSLAVRRYAIRQKAEHLILLNLYDEALVEMNKIIKLESEGTTSWLNSIKIIILIEINQNKYKEAHDTYQKLVAHKSYRNTKSTFKRSLELINVYFYLFKLMEVIPNDLKDNKSEVKRYLADYPEFGKDKGAMNIPVIIAQLLEAIILKRESDVLDRMEALKKYSSRYITKNKGVRSNCFINMLLEIVRNNYHVVAIERHARKYFTKLVANPKISTEEAAEVEFIPYEHLWDIILNFLKKRRSIEVSKR
ncbi:MAG: hypothetical protein IPN29_04770 [Saprospiraceae bacterium]|nr:hypothetical protein [Saprospiraceae bacterium]